MLQIVASLIDAARGVIYDRHMVIVQATGVVKSTSICGLYYKCFTIVIHNCNDSGQYYITTITIVIDDRNWWS